MGAALTAVPSCRDPQLAGHHVNYRHLIVQFYYQYANLLVNSFGLQNAMERAPIDLPHFFSRCYGSAMTFIGVVRQLGPLGHFTFAPDSHFVFLSYAVLTLLKVRRLQCLLQGCKCLRGEPRSIVDSAGLQAIHWGREKSSRCCDGNGRPSGESRCESVAHARYVCWCPLTMSVRLTQSRLE